MSARIGSLLVLVSALVLSAGCYSTQEGRLKMGVPFAKDTITSRYEVPFAQAHEAAKTVIKNLGTLTSDDQVTKVLRGVVNQRNVWIQIDDSEPKIVVIRIQARTSAGGADISLASEIDKQIYGEFVRTR